MTYLLERAWIDGAFVDDVAVDVADGRFTRVEPGARPEPALTRVAGLTIPGLANGHSHAFHRALRGRTQRGRGSFWTWREQMYEVAARLDPETYLELATATYREMALAGITTVGEFHYLHHGPGGTPYDDPGEMGSALVEAARRAGVRLCLLDTLYLSSGFGAAPEGVQARYDDRTAEGWARRMVEAKPADDVVIGAAIHSIRAVPTDALGVVVESAAGRPLHVHLSEQPSENEACLAAYGATPTRVLADHGVLGPLTTAVHATHLSLDDIALLGACRCHVCLCPTTERDLGDGAGSSRRLREAGCALTLGSDSHAVIDLFEEMRAVELHERLTSGTRGHQTAAALMTAGFAHASLGFADAGRIEVGARADLVTIDASSVRTAGAGRDEAAVVFAAGAEDVVSTMVGGLVVATREERGDAARALERAIDRVWP